ncbi:MAG: FAD binding domain-containing protein [Spirochaetes bacterium]|uniref:FAD binding domain-containing protein n=1 Tax=Candidatus Ornithospirochaeta stercoripullorum TaxID=2840899 RepID=A0A9D9DZ07_9SPIO|nr:FAD binding domain-containing protein [Candidatus Ornithospirochaeta stercoripullorum]
MTIYHPLSAEEAVKLRHDHENSLYLAGGTEILRLGSDERDVDVLIDISNLSLSGITEKSGRVEIGAMTTLEEIRESELVPQFIRDAAAFCASLQIRNRATIGGNFALRRTDSYLVPALLAAEAEVKLMCNKGEKTKSVAEYFEKKECKGLLLSFSIEADRKGCVRRIARSSHAHAAVTGSLSESVYAYAVSSSGIAYGSKDSWKDINYVSDLTGSAEYKRYLASVLFEE